MAREGDSETVTECENEHGKRRKENLSMQTHYFLPSHSISGMVVFALVGQERFRPFKCFKFIIFLKGKGFKERQQES